jgi:Xaa-Pro aminopeptidase
LGLSQLQKIRQKLEQQELDALLVSRGENRRYLSGFTGSDGWLLISNSVACLAIDFRYVEQAKREASDFETLHIKGNLANWLPDLVSSLNYRSIGFEADDISYSTFNQLCDVLKDKQQFKLIPTTNLVESNRAVKEPQELEYIIQAAALADAVLEYIRAFIHPGITEKQVAWEIEKWLREKGSETLPFDIIVASGPNAALPHAKPSQRVINRSEPVVIDLGARVDGYCSDLTRTLCCGEEDETFLKIYDITLGAQLAALAAIREGMNGEQADQLSRIIIEQANYGDAFGHGLGHGVGLVAHELPRLGTHSTDVLVDGMVFTVEPGIYLPGWGGVRIEDTVVLRNGKIETLTKASKSATISQ